MIPRTTKEVTVSKSNVLTKAHKALVILKAYILNITDSINIKGNRLQTCKKM